MTDTNYMTATQSPARQKFNAHISSTSTQVLMTSLSMMEAAGVNTSEERLVVAAISDELCLRHPEVDEVLDAWIDSDDDTRTYSEVLLAAIKL